MTRPSRLMRISWVAAFAGSLGMAIAIPIDLATHAMNAATPTWPIALGLICGAVIGVLGSVALYLIDGVQSHRAAGRATDLAEFRRRCETTKRRSAA